MYLFSVFPFTSLLTQLESYPGRDQLASDLGLDTTSSLGGPLIASIIHRASSVNNTVPSSTTTPPQPVLNTTSTTAASRIPHKQELYPVAQPHAHSASMAAQDSSVPLVNGVLTGSGLDTAATLTSMSPWDNGCGEGSPGDGGAGDTSSPLVGESGEQVARSSDASLPLHSSSSSNGKLCCPYQLDC